MKKIFWKVHAFLLTNTSSKQTVIKNTFWLFLAELVSKGSVAVITILIWRLFGAEIFGAYSYWWVILAFLIIFADLWLTTLLIRDYQHLESHQRFHYLSQWLKTKWLLSMGVIILFTIVLFILGESILIKQIWLMLLVYGLVSSFLEYLRGTFRSLQRSQVEFQIKLIQGVGNLFIIPLIFYVDSVVPIIAMQAIVWILTIIYAILIIYRKQEFSTQDEEYWIQKTSLVKSSWMFAMSGLFVSVYHYIDTIILKYYVWYQEIWIYNAAYKLWVMLIIPAIIMWSAAMPKLRALFLSNKEEFSRIIWFLSKLTILAAVIIFPILIHFSNNILHITYWELFTQWTDVLKIVFLSFWILYLYNIYSWAIYSTWYQRYHLYITLIWWILNWILNVMFIPKYWILWAASTTLITEIILWISMYRIYLTKIK